MGYKLPGSRQLSQQGKQKKPRLKRRARRDLTEARVKEKVHKLHALAASTTSPHEAAAANRAAARLIEQYERERKEAGPWKTVKAWTERFRARDRERDPEKPKKRYVVSYKGIGGAWHSYEIEAPSSEAARSAAYLRHGHGRAKVFPMQIRGGVARRDPVDLPKSIRTKKTAIERSIRKLAEGANGSRESVRLKQKIDDAIFRFQQHGRNAGVDLTELSNILDGLFRAAVVAMNRSVENYQKHLDEQAAHYRQKAREAQSRPGSYEHELSMMRGGYRK